MDKASAFESLVSEAQADPEAVEMSVLIYSAPIAQLDRASVFGTECCRFDSCWAHIIMKTRDPP